MPLADILGSPKFQRPESVVRDFTRHYLPELETQLRIEARQKFPFVLFRQADTAGHWRGDPRFIDDAEVFVEVFARGADADSNAHDIHDAIHHRALRRALSEQLVLPGVGHLTRLKLLNRGRRKPDWATATGPVQYADLPSDATRYEARYHLKFRPSA